MNSSASPLLQLPVELWLLVLAQFDDNLVELWCVVRNVSHFFRACVDDFFSHGIVQKTLINLRYSDIHTQSGPTHAYLHLPMVFDHLSDNGHRAIFQQRAFKQTSNFQAASGSLRGWVPFLERYAAETRQKKPTIVNKSKPDPLPPLWEREHAALRNTLQGDRKSRYMLIIRDMTSLARGDRPPFYIRISKYINDSDLVDLVVDCEQREISFNWRQTFMLFFREHNMIARAGGMIPPRRYDKDLDGASAGLNFRIKQDRPLIRARRKRLHPWVKKNKHRMSTEMRLATEKRVEREMEHLKKHLFIHNLEPVKEDPNAAPEIVPEKLAKDHADLLFWPRVDDTLYYSPPRSLKACIIM